MSRNSATKKKCACRNPEKSGATACRLCKSEFQEAIDLLFKLTPVNKVLKFVIDFDKEIELYMNRIIFHSQELTSEERSRVSELLSCQKEILLGRIDNYISPTSNDI